MRQGSINEYQRKVIEFAVDFQEMSVSVWQRQKKLAKLASGTLEAQDLQKHEYEYDLVVLGGRLLKLCLELWSVGCDCSRSVICGLKLLLRCNLWCDPAIR